MGRSTKKAAALNRSGIEAGGSPMTATAVNGEQGRKKIAEAETGRIHRGRPRFSGRIRRKPEHVEPAPHGARASTGRVIRRGRKEAPILPNVNTKRPVPTDGTS